MFARGEDRRGEELELSELLEPTGISYVSF